MAFDAEPHRVGYRLCEDISYVILEGLMAVEPIDLAEITDGNSQLRLFLLHHNPPIIPITLLILLNLLMKLLILHLLL